MRFTSIVLALTLLLGVPVIAAAAFLGGEDLVETTQNIAEDLFAAGNTVSIQHGVAQDIFAAGNVVDIDAEVGQDVFAAGNQVRLTGAVGDDVMAAGATVTLSGQVAEDAYLAGSEIMVTAEVGGNLRAAGDRIVLASGTVVAGDLITWGNAEPIIENGVTIRGSRLHRSPEQHDVASVSQTIAAWVRGVVTWFFVALILLSLTRSALTEAIGTMLGNSGRSLMVGVIAALALLPLILLAILSIVGWPVALLALLGGAAHLIVAHALAAIAVGVWTGQRFIRSEESAPQDIRWPQVLLGATLLGILTWLPVIGWAVGLVVTLLAWGALLQTMWRRLRSVT
ncbi:MAG TPA: hypothetical protein VJC05_03770 [Candidatus Andersenbacteria bacterium]|nr:hypothetical protein [Candidatus Andersenbacteria bacterium]